MDMKACGQTPPQVSDGTRHMSLSCICSSLLSLEQLQPYSSRQLSLSHQNSIPGAMSHNCPWRSCNSQKSLSPAALGKGCHPGTLQAALGGVGDDAQGLASGCGRAEEEPERAAYNSCREGPGQFTLGSWDARSSPLPSSASWPAHSTLRRLHQDEDSDSVCCPPLASGPFGRGKEDACPSLEGSPDREGGGPPLSVNISSQGQPTSLLVSWVSAEPDGFDYALSLRGLNPLGSSEGQQLQAHTNESSFEFHGLVPGSRYQLELTVLRSCWQNVTVILTARTEPVSPDHLVLRALDTSSLQAFWNSSEGAAWFHLMLTDLLGVTNLTAVVRRGVSNHTFLHLSPGTPYELKFCVAAGPHWVVGPNATEWTYPSYPSDLVLTPLSNELWASWKAGPGARDGYVLKLSGPLENTTTLGPEECNVVFPGPLPPGHYTLGLKVLAGPYDAWVEASTLLAESAALPRESPGARLWLDGLEATKQPGRRALLYADGAPGLLRNISVPSGATHVTFCGLVPGAHYRVDIASWVGDITQSITGYTNPLPPQSLEVTNRSSPSDLTIGWAPAPGQQEGYKFTWHQDGSQRSPGNLVSVGPDNSSLTLMSLVPGSCYTVSAWAWAGNLSSSLQKIHSCTPPLAPPLVNVTSEAPTQLQAFWIHAPGGRNSYQVSLYQGDTRTATSIMGPKTDSTSFSGLTPGTKYKVEVISWAGPLFTAATNVSAWT
ncbi:hypothetical protein STEG23_015869, partial [Scotinomys teguina]